MTMKIVGQDWADRYPDKFIDHDPQPGFPCIVCGDPTGNCAPHTEDEPMEIEKKPHPASPSPVAGRGRRTDAVTPPVPDGFIPVEGQQSMIVAVREVYVSFVPRNAKRESTVLLFPKGTITSYDGYHKRLDMYAGYSSLEVK